MSHEPYSRIYWRFRDEFPDVYQDNDALATWLRLLVIAEGAHPSAGDLPRKVKRGALDLLVECELITLLAGDRFRVRGLDAERNRRSEAGRTGGLASGRSRSERTNVEPSLNERSRDERTKSNLDETSKDEQRRDETRNTARPNFEGPLGPELAAIYDRAQGDDPVPPDARRLQKLAVELTGIEYVIPHVNGGLGAKAMNEQVIPHGFDRVEVAWRKVAAQVRAAGTSKPTLRQLVFGADEILNPIPKADSKEQRQDEDRAAYNRRVEATRKRIAEYQN